jgi:methylase of polypeptide subunit release factors
MPPMYFLQTQVLTARHSGKLPVKQSLVKGGRFYFEFNEKYGAEMTDLMKEKGYADIRIIQDLSGKNRFAVCTKN